MANIFRTASLWLKVAVGCMALGLVLFVIGFATRSWIIWPNSDTTRGLWEYYGCSGSRYGKSCGSRSYYILNDYHRAIQAMECIGLIGFVLAILALLLYMCVDACRRRDFLQGSTIFTFGGILFSCIGFAIFGSSSNVENKGYGGDIGWSMGIAIAGAVCYGIAGIMLILQLIGR